MFQPHRPEFPALVRSRIQHFGRRERLSDTAVVELPHFAIVVDRLVGRLLARSRQVPDIFVSAHLAYAVDVRVRRSGIDTDKAADIGIALNTRPGKVVCIGSVLGASGKGSDIIVAFNRTVDMVVLRGTTFLRPDNHTDIVVAANDQVAFRTHALKVGTLVQPGNTTHIVPADNGALAQPYSRNLGTGIEFREQADVILVGAVDGQLENAVPVSDERPAEAFGSADGFKTGTHAVDAVVRRGFACIKSLQFVMGVQAEFMLADILEVIVAGNLERFFRRTFAHQGIARSVIDQCSRKRGVHFLEIRIRHAFLDSPHGLKVKPLERGLLQQGISRERFTQLVPIDLPFGRHKRAVEVYVRILLVVVGILHGSGNSLDTLAGALHKARRVNIEDGIGIIEIQIRTAHNAPNPIMTLDDIHGIGICQLRRERPEKTSDTGISRDGARTREAIHDVRVRYTDKSTDIAMALDRRVV